MKTFTLIVCTYMRTEALSCLLQSVTEQTLYPSEILIIDGSTNNETQDFINKTTFKNLKYFKVEDENRGLTKQRNYGIARVSETSEIVCFLDDDVVLKPDYFENLISTYNIKPEALGIGGYIVNEIDWELSNKKNDKSKFYFDGWMRNEPSRFKIRRKFGLEPDVPPGFLPTPRRREAAGRTGGGARRGAGRHAGQR